MLGPIEAHVLQEVGKTVLVRRFLNGTYVGGQIELGPSLGQFVVADVIGETIVQMADAHLVRVGNLRHLGDVGFHLLARGLLGQGHQGRQGQQTQGKEEFLHIINGKVYFQKQIYTKFAILC